MRHNDHGDRRKERRVNAYVRSAHERGGGKGSFGATCARVNLLDWVDARLYLKAVYIRNEQLL